MARNPVEWIPYCGAAPAPAELFARWNFDPPLLLGIGLAAALAWRIPRLRTWRTAAALAIVLVLFVSPFCALGSALFSARVVHHLVLALVLGPWLAPALGPARGFAPLEDQQIAGLIMWAPAAAAYLLVAVTILYRSLAHADVRAVRI